MIPTGLKSLNPYSNGMKIEFNEIGVGYYFVDLS